MEAARRRQPDVFEDEERASLGALLDAEEFANILRLRPQEHRSAPREAARPLSASDISAALELVHEAAVSIREADGRIRESEGRMRTQLQRAVEELKASEARAEAAEARAAEAEARAEEAENWLRQIFSTISEELPIRR